MKYLALCTVLVTLVVALILELVLPVSLIFYDNIDIPVAVLTMLYSNGMIFLCMYNGSEAFETLSARQQSLLACAFTIMIFDILLICI